jgi:hypothetical protein
MNVEIGKQNIIIGINEATQFHFWEIRKENMLLQCAHCRES